MWKAQAQLLRCQCCLRLRIRSCSTPAATSAATSSAAEAAPAADPECLAQDPLLRLCLKRPASSVAEAVAAVAVAVRRDAVAEVVAAVAVGGTVAAAHLHVAKSALASPRLGVCRIHELAEARRPILHQANSKGDSHAKHRVDRKPSSALPMPLAPSASTFAASADFQWPTLQSVNSEA